MKLIYFRNEMYMPGGIGRVLSDRINYLVEKYNYDIYVIVMNQEDKELYYSLNKKINFIDLKINYKFRTKNIFFNLIGKIYKNIIYRNKIKKLIKNCKPDFLISMGELDTFFIPSLKKEKLKVIREYHFNKGHRLYRKEYNFITKLKNILVTKYEEYVLKKYDKIIVLTNEDKEKWNEKYSIEVIYNPLTFFPQNISNLKNKKIISVGRLEEQKGYDILINVWNIVSKKYPDWILEIYGEGSERENLQNKINKLGLEKSFLLKGATKDIQDKYLESSIYVMSSRYEGMPMVLLEAMACGLPIVSFNCPCGPKDIIKDKEDGFLIPFGDIELMAEKIEELIIDEEKRKLFGKNAKRNVQRFSQDKIMNQWQELFENLRGVED